MTNTKDSYHYIVAGIVCLLWEEIVHVCWKLILEGKKKHDWNYWLCSGCTDREIWYYRKQAQRLATCSWCITLCICRCFYPNWLILIAIHFISNVFPGNQTHAEQEHTCWAFCSSGDAGSRPHFTSPFTKNDYSVRNKKLSVITTLITNQIFAFIITAAS